MFRQAERTKKAAESEMEQQEVPIREELKYEDILKDAAEKKVILEKSILDIRAQIKKAEKVNRNESQVLELEEALRTKEREKTSIEKHLAYEKTREAVFTQLKELENEIRKQTEEVKKVENSDVNQKSYTVKIRGEKESPAGKAYTEELAKLRLLEKEKKDLKLSIDTKWKRNFLEQNVFESEEKARIEGIERQRVADKQRVDAEERARIESIERQRVADKQRVDAEDRARKIANEKKVASFGGKMAKLLNFFRKEKKG